MESEKILYFQDLNFTTRVKDLKSIGYKYQELYARNYKTYRKEIAGFTFWLWVKGKTIEINDWYSYTANIIKFYKENIEQWKIDNSKLPRPRSHFKLYANHNTGEIKEFDYNEYYNAIKLLDENRKDGEKDGYDEYLDKYKNWREIVLHIESFEEVLKEIEFLTK
jgi:hypothetical protein